MEAFYQVIENGYCLHHCYYRLLNNQTRCTSSISKLKMYIFNFSNYTKLNCIESYLDKASVKHANEVDVISFDSVKRQVYKQEEASLSSKLHGNYTILILCYPSASRLK